MSCTTETVWLVGQQPKLTADFKTTAGVLTDPSAVTFKIKLPSGTTTTYVYGVDSQLVRASTGSYYVLWTLTSAGTHTYSYTGTGTLTAYSEASFAAQAQSL
jgi:hypothetical protein